MYKYFIIFLSAFVLEIGSTFYINGVASHNLGIMAFFAFMGPMLSLPFVNFVIEAKNWKDRGVLAIIQSFGYCFGSIVSYFFLT